MGELHRETSRLLYSKVDRAIPISTSCLLSLQGILGKENLQLGRNPRFLDIRSSRQNASALFLPVTGAGCHTVYPLCVPHSLPSHVPHSLLPATSLLWWVTISWPPLHIFEFGAQDVVQAGLELTILFPQPPQCVELIDIGHHAQFSLPFFLGGVHLLTHIYWFSKDLIAESLLLKL